MAVTWALMDPVMTIARPVAAFFSAFATGILENVFAPEQEGLSKQSPDQACPVDSCCNGTDCTPEEHAAHHSFHEKIFAGLMFAVTDVWSDLAAWFFTGLLLAGMISVFVPSDALVSGLGGGLGSMFLMLAVGIPIYICATASTPVAAALIMKGVSPGTALVFLLAGPATNVTSLSMITAILGRRGTVVYLISLASCAVISGLLLDVLYVKMGISATAMAGQAGEILPFWLRFTGAIILLAMSIRPIVDKTKNLLSRRQTDKEQSKKSCCSSDSTGHGKAAGT